MTRHNHSANQFVSHSSKYVPRAADLWRVSQYLRYQCRDGDFKNDKIFDELTVEPLVTS